MESAWSNGKAAYRCRHGHTSAVRPDPARPKNAYVRENKVLAQLHALHSLLTCPRRPGAGPAARGWAAPHQTRDRDQCPGQCRGHHRLPARAPGHAHLGPGCGDAARRHPSGHHHPGKLTRGPSERARRMKGRHNRSERPPIARRRAKPAPRRLPQHARKQDIMGFYWVRKSTPYPPDCSISCNAEIDLWPGSASE
jgi:hypothetical protein